MLAFRRRISRTLPVPPVGAEGAGAAAGLAAGLAAGFDFPEDAGAGGTETGALPNSFFVVPVFAFATRATNSARAIASSRTYPFTTSSARNAASSFLASPDAVSHQAAMALCADFMTGLLKGRST